MSKEKTKKDFLSAREIAEVFSLHPQYVRDCARLGIFPALKVGTSWRFKLSEVEAKLRQNAAIAVERSLLSSTTPNQNE